MTETKIGFIGGGNMAEAISRGIVKAGLYSWENVIISDPWEPRRNFFTELGATATADNAQVVRDAQVVVLAIKPQSAKDCLGPLTFPKDTIIVSILAGYTIPMLFGVCGPNTRIVRVMPNTPMLCAEGAAVVVGSANASSEDVATVERIFSSVAPVTRVVQDDHLMHAVTGLSGSGPGYMFRMLEGMIQGGVSAGLDREMATALAAQTMIGAGKLALNSMKALGGDGATPDVLRERVTSKDGTTHAGLKKLESLGFKDAVAAAVEAAAARSIEMGQGSM